MNNRDTLFIISKNGSSATGIASFIFGLISIFVFAPIFVPLSLVCGIISVLKQRSSWGMIGLVLAVIGFLTSPILMGSVGIATIAANMSAHHSNQPIPPPSDIQLRKLASRNAEISLLKCRNKRLNGELKSYVESVKCSAPEIYKSYQNINFPYMDLIENLNQKREEIAKQIDSKDLSEEQANKELKAFTETLDSTIKQRDYKKKQIIR